MRYFKALSDIDGGRIKTGEVVPTSAIGAASVDKLVEVGAIEVVDMLDDKEIAELADEARAKEPATPAPAEPAQPEPAKADAKPAAKKK